MPKSCPSGKIKRKEYTTKRGTKVESTCIKNVGAPGKTPESKKVLPKLKEGYLGKYGYRLANNDTKRKASLHEAMKNEGDLEVLRRVVVLRTYMKNEPLKFKKLDKDVKYIQKIREKNKASVKKTSKKRTTKQKSKVKSALRKIKSKSKIKKRVRFRI